MNRDALLKTVDQYQEIYRIKDWDIKVRINQKKSKNFAITLSYPDEKVAVITFYPKCFEDKKNSDLSNVEKTVRHELFHVVMSPLRQFIYNMIGNHIDEKIWKYYEKIEEDICCHVERFKI